MQLKNMVESRDLTKFSTINSMIVGKLSFCTIKCYVTKCSNDVENISFQSYDNFIHLDWFLCPYLL